MAAASEAAAATRTLRRPVVTASAQLLEYQKTFTLDIAGPRDNALGATQDFLSTIPGSVPPAYQQIVGEVVGRIDQALPGLFDQIPDSLSYQYRQTILRPTLQAALPIYTGGAIPAIQRGAQAGVKLAQSRGAQARDVARLNLVRLYFGQLTAQSLEQSALESREALGALDDDAAKLEAAGVLPHANRLEARVARDTAELALQRATMFHASARDDLASVLDMQAVNPSTSLFIRSRPLPPVETFLGREDDMASVKEAAASHDVAGAAVDLAKSRFRPQVFAFGEYNANRQNALPTEPDWVVGIGARITLMSGLDRGHTLAAARQGEMAAVDAGREARRNATQAIRRAWDLVESARRSFLLLGSSLAAATENLRIQRVALREGEGTVTRVAGAEAALATARAQRISAAYEYDLTLAGLLTASGRMDEFADYMHTADIRLMPENGR